MGLNSNEVKKIATHNTTINSIPEDNNYSKYAQARELYKSLHKLRKNNKKYKLT